MKHIFSALLIFGLFLANCQKIELSDQLSFAFKKGADYYKMNESSKIFKNQNALKFIEKAKTNRTLGYIFSGIGGFGIGFGLASMLAPKEETVYIGGSPITQKKSTMGGYALVGAGFVLGSIPFYVGTKKNIKKAVDAENSDQGLVKDFREFSIYGSGTGIGLAYKF